MLAVVDQMRSTKRKAKYNVHAPKRCKAFSSRGGVRLCRSAPCRILGAIMSLDCLLQIIGGLCLGYVGAAIYNYFHGKG